MAGKDTNQFYGPGGWRDSKSLEMGSPKGRGCFYAVCIQCNTILHATSTTVGKICSKCGKYNSISDRKFDDLDELQKEYPDVIIGENQSSYHIIDSEKKAFIDLRDNMTEKAYKFRETKGNRNIYHGPKRADGTRAK